MRHETITIAIDVRRTITPSDPENLPGGTDDEPVEDWQSGIVVSASGDYTLSVETDDLAGNETETMTVSASACTRCTTESRKKRIRCARAIRWPLRSQPAGLITGALDDCGIYHEFADTLGA